MTRIDERAVRALATRARREVDDGVLASCQLALGLDGDVVFEETVGAPADSRYVIWSATKPVVAAAVWLRFADGTLTPDTRVIDLVPEFGTNGKDDVTVEHLLLHTAGFPHAPLFAPAWSTKEGRLRAFESWRPFWPSGTKYTYADFANHWVLAELVERTTGRDYRDAVHEQVVGPLGLATFRLGEPAGGDQGLPLHVTGERASQEEHEAAGVPWSPPRFDHELHLFMNDPEARAVGIPGAGGIAKAADLARFYQGLLHDAGALFDPGVLADVTGTVRNTYPDPKRNNISASRSRGLVIRGDDGHGHLRHHFGDHTSPRAFGHDGAGGQVAWADPASGLSFAYVTNGMDANGVREHRRCRDLANLAARCAA